MQRLREPGGLVRSFKGDRSLRSAYEVDATPLGEGRYSRVFGATHRATGARRAIKTADRQGAWTQYVDLGMECPGRLACHEAEILRRLDHPNVIRILEVFEEKKSVHLVLELCEGGDVLERILISNGRLPESDIATLFMQMLFAVWHLHQNGVVHRDLKPEHFLFTVREPEIEPRPPQLASMKLIDFGLSHKAGIAFAPEGGTPQFMSPEARSGRSGRDFADRGDMWSLGVVLHAMLVGHYPSPHLDDKKQAQYFARPAWSGISAPGIELIGLLLRQSPSVRPSAAEALQHPWSKAAIGRTVRPPEPLLKGAALAAKAYTSASGLRRLALAAVAREVADSDVIGLRQVLQVLELRCDGKLARSSLLKAASTEGPVGEAASVLFRAFDSFTDVSGILTWTELVAVFQCAAPSKDTGAGNYVPVRDEACWRAFDLLSQGTGSVSGSALELFLPRGGRGNGSERGSPRNGLDNGNGNGYKAGGLRLPKDGSGQDLGGAFDAQAIHSAVKEVAPSGSLAFPEFMRLARGLIGGGGRGLSISNWLGFLYACVGRGRASAPAMPRSPSPGTSLPSASQRQRPTPLLGEPPSPTNSAATTTPRPTPRGSPAASTVISGSTPASPERRKRRGPLSILGTTSL